MGSEDPWVLSIAKTLNFWKQGVLPTQLSRAAKLTLGTFSVSSYPELPRPDGNPEH